MKLWALVKNEDDNSGCEKCQFDELCSRDLKKAEKLAIDNGFLNIWAECGGKEIIIYKPTIFLKKKRF